MTEALYRRLEQIALGPDARRKIWGLALELRLKGLSCKETRDFFEPALEWLPDETVGYVVELLRYL